MRTQDVPPQSNIIQDQASPIDTTVFADSTTDNALIDEAIDKSEYYYAKGVHYFQISKLDSAQATYEQALSVISEMDIDPDESPEQATRLETLLNEIEQDYRLTLMSSGELSSESSTIAFRELFDDLKNFKKLKESEEYHTFAKADTVIYDIQIEYNEKVENSLAYLQTVARGKFETYLENAAKYLPLMEKIFKDKGLPHDLVYLPLIESGFKANAYSYARASGFWQFISSTGRIYGLEHNWWYDERRDFEKSTEAAASHLKDLYDTFSSWNLALAAYNAGAGRISKEMKRKKSSDFWKLKLPSQTRSYVPLFMAAIIIAKEPEKYGFHPNYPEPLEYEKIKIDKCLSFNNISAATGIPVSELEILNPELLRGVTPPNLPEYYLRIPIGFSDKFTQAYNSIESEKTTWAQHQVRKGETISTIARKYGVSIAAIVQANGIDRRHRLSAGKQLIIPIPPSGASSRKTVVARTEKSKPIETDSSGKYLVKNGDTLYDIATAYGVSMSSLRDFNNLPGNTIYAGRWLNIPIGSEKSNDSKSIKGFVKYGIRRGDSLAKIAMRQNTTIEILKDINGLSSARIYPGMSIKVPSNGSSNNQAVADNSNDSNSLDYKMHTIRQGDSLWKLAKIYSVAVNEITRWNNISERTKLYPGDKLKIYLK